MQICTVFNSLSFQITNQNVAISYVTAKKLYNIGPRSSISVTLKRKLSVHFRAPSTIKVPVEDPVEQFNEAEYFAMLAHAVSGGIESPLQFVLQVLCN